MTTTNPNANKYSNDNSKTRMMVMDGQKYILDMIEKYSKIRGSTVNGFVLITFRNFRIEPECYSLLLIDTWIPGMTGIGIRQ
jgi:hypothetical protein